MPAPRILFVKLSSLGDVVHHLPAVTDVAERYPDAHVSWAIEEAYVDIARLHPAVAETIEVGLRGMRRHPLAPGALEESLLMASRTLREGRWDYVIDTQGLLKKRLVARSGIPRPSFVRPGCHQRPGAPRRALLRCEGAGAAGSPRGRTEPAARGPLGYRPRGLANSLESRLPAQPRCWSSRESLRGDAGNAREPQARRWPRIIGSRSGGQSPQGFVTVFPGGTVSEREESLALARDVSGAIAAPADRRACALIGNADGVVGVDTGLTHLAVALGVPTVGIYRATSPELLRGCMGASMR